MFGIMIALAWIAFGAVAGHNICQSSLSAANFLWWWYACWAIGLGALSLFGGPIIGAIGGRGAGFLIGGGIGVFLAFLFLVSGAFYVSATWLYLSAAPAEAPTDWSGFNQQKLILAGIMGVLGILSSLFSRSCHTSSKSSD